MPAKKIWAIVAGLFSILILSIPDALPILDEAGAALILIWAIKEVFGKGGGPAPKPPTTKPPEKNVN